MTASGTPCAALKVVVVGGGFSGALQAISLLRHCDCEITLVEKRPRAGRGIAYSAASPQHLLNVRAGNMSALPDQPDHFTRWLERHHPACQTGFAPRLVYGDYLCELLGDAERLAEGRLTLLRAEVTDLQAAGDGTILHLADGRVLHADIVVLALGTLLPETVPGIDETAFAPDVYVGDPWSEATHADLTSSDTVLTVGSGLTSIDVILKLAAEHFEGKILSLSRHGLLPRAHLSGVVTPVARRDQPPCSPILLSRAVRERAEVLGWHSAVDELRPHTQALWQAASLDEKGRFLRHLRPWWDVHRHRLAPQVARLIADLMARGQLDVIKGKISAATSRSGGADVAYVPRGRGQVTTVSVRRIVNCTGPKGDIRRTGDPLLRNLISRGTIRPDPLHIGVDVAPSCELIDRSGRLQPGLFAVGPVTRSTFWEVVAVPDIRLQVDGVARRIAKGAAVH